MSILASAGLIQVENGGQSWYNGLVVQLRKRMSHGLEGSVAYTWSHAIDTANMGGGTNALFFDTSGPPSMGTIRRTKRPHSLISAIGL